MKKTIFFLLGLALIAISYNNAFAQKTPEQVIEKFFFAYKNNKPTSAVNYIFSTNPWIKERSKDQVESLKVQLQNTVSLIGDYYGYEPITSRQVGESLVLYSYLIKYERQPLRFTFIFYKPSEEWMIQNFKFDSDIDEELEEAARIYLLNVYDY